MNRVKFLDFSFIDLNANQSYVRNEYFYLTYSIWESEATIWFKLVLTIWWWPYLKCQTFFHFKFWRANVFSKLTFMFCVGFITSCIIVHCLIMIGPNLVQSQHKSLQMPFFFLTWWTHNLNFRALFSSLASHISKWIHSIETVVINSGFFAHSELKMES